MVQQAQNSPLLSPVTVIIEQIPLSNLLNGLRRKSYSLAYFEDILDVLKPLYT